MATKKQRSRRDKTFRHDMELVQRDDEGNEIPVTAKELEAAKGKPEKAKSTPAKKGSARSAKKGAARGAKKGAAKKGRGKR